MASSAVKSPGTVTFHWFRPQVSPGEAPEKTKVASCAATVAANVVAVGISSVEDAKPEESQNGSVAPPPVPNNATVLPTGAGLAAVFTDPS